MVNASLNQHKYQAQSQLKKETNELRTGENRQKSELKKEEDSHQKNIEAQQAIAAI
jgi:hypothetical protein